MAASHRILLLQGQHPKHRRLQDPALLSEMDQVQIAMLEVPAVQTRLAAATAMFSFDENVELASPLSVTPACSSVNARLVVSIEACKTVCASF